MGQRPGDILALLLITSMTTSEAIKRDPQGEATWATAAPTSTDHSTMYPGGGASKQVMAVASPFVSTRSIGPTLRDPSDRPKTGRMRSRLG